MFLNIAYSKFKKIYTKNNSYFYFFNKKQLKILFFYNISKLPLPSRTTTGS